jgi:hypothetical protein
MCVSFSSEVDSNVVPIEGASQGVCTVFDRFAFVNNSVEAFAIKEKFDRVIRNRKARTVKVVLETLHLCCHVA